MHFHRRLYSPPNAEDGTAYGFGNDDEGQCTIPMDLLGILVPQGEDLVPSSTIPREDVY